MRRPENKRLAWLLTAALAASTVTQASSASAQPDPVQVPAMGVGMPTPTLPPASPSAAAGNAATAVPNAGTVDATVPPTHRETLNDCMAYWDAETHMSKTEWREACRRTQNGADMMGGLDLLLPEHAATGGRRGHRHLSAGSRP
jgi:hypothetical protein